MLAFPQARQGPSDHGAGSVAHSTQLHKPRHAAKIESPRFCCTFGSRQAGCHQNRAPHLVRGGLGCALQRYAHLCRGLILGNFGQHNLIQRQADGIRLRAVDVNDPALNGAVIGLRQHGRSHHPNPRATGQDPNHHANQGDDQRAQMPRAQAHKAQQPQQNPCQRDVKLRLRFGLKPKPRPDSKG